MPANKNSASIVKFIKYWVPVIIYAIFIFHLSSIPGEDLPKLFAYQDIVFHIIEYALFAILINRAFKSYWPVMIYLRRFLWVFCVAMVYAIGDEIHQLFILDRLASVYDLFYDGVGVFITNIFYK